MDKLKRIFALVLVILLIGLYVVTFISGIMATPYTQGLFKGCIAATVIIPVFMYAYKLIYDVMKKDDVKKDENNESK